MGLFSYKTPASAPFVPPRSVGFKMVREWDYAAARYVYVLIEEQEFTPHVVVQRRFLGAPVGPSWCENGEPRILPLRRGTGSLAWARRTAHHYKIKFKE